MHGISLSAKIVLENLGLPRWIPFKKRTESPGQSLAYKTNQKALVKREWEKFEMVLSINPNCELIGN